MKTRRHINIPIFIPHLGCPNNCVFCNQRSISGHGEFKRESVRDEIETALETIPSGTDCEIAFFGGSFTGIERVDMLYLLELAAEYVERGLVRSIRLSTRPDYVDNEILDILVRYPVTDIELGLQSLSDRVLSISKRGHTAKAALEACERVKSRGFTLTGQMMIGLPGSSAEDELMTAREIARLCDSARIYPTVVFANTELCEMYRRGEYTPPTLDEMIERSARALGILTGADKPVLRIGLCSSDSLTDPERAVAGANHPALGELILGELYFERISERLAGLKAEAAPVQITVRVNPRELSKAVGQKRKNLSRLTSMYGDVRIIGDSEIEAGQIEITIK